jgi:hypothetical protein
MRSDERLNRSPRSVAIAEHLWSAVESMAREMGLDPDSLVNQALFTFARLNGYVVPGRPMGRVTSLESAASLPDEPQLPPPPVIAPQKPMVPAGRTPTAQASPAITQPPRPAAPSMSMSLPPPPEPEAESAAEMMQDIGGGTEEAPSGVDDVDAAVDELQGKESMPEEAEPEEAPEAEAEEAAAPELDAEEAEAEAEDEEEEASSTALFLMVRDREPVRVDAERFLIGRGKHCHFVIDSNRVSREHAVITREGAEVMLEDLNSSNGTWFEKKKITKRKIKDGDEIVFGTERVKFSFRPSFN